MPFWVCKAFSYSVKEVLNVRSCRWRCAPLQCHRQDLVVCSRRNIPSYPPLMKHLYNTNARNMKLQSSGVMAEKMMEWIESDECVQACGLERMSVGMSTDDLSAYSQFTSKLCSDRCQNSCPDVVDLYLNLAAGEGTYLPQLCEARKTRSRRMMYQTAGGEKAYYLGAATAYAPAPY